MTLNAKKLAQYANDPAEFRNDLLVDAGGAVVRLGNALDKWQAEDFAAVDPGWRRCIGQDVPGGCSRAFLERPRGHSKTSDLAVSAAWALAFAPKPIRGAMAAGDRDQAALIRNAIERLASLNPWLGGLFDIAKYTITNKHTGSTLEILSADAATSYGMLLDFVLADEITHWGPGGEALWHSLWSTVAKRARCFCGIITNAGNDKGSCWQWHLREAARQSDAWYFHSLHGCQASWISESALAQQAAILPASVMDRLFRNVWQEGGAGDAIPIELIDRAIVLDGPQHLPDEQSTATLGVDLAVRRDAASVVLLLSDSVAKQVRVAQVHTWHAPTNGEIDLQAVQDTTRRLAYQFNAVVAYDPHQAGLFVQQLQRGGVQCREMAFTPANLHTMATCALAAFSERKLLLHHHTELIAGIKRLRIEETRFGSYKLTAARDAATGHADAAVAMTIALPRALELIASHTGAWTLTPGFLGSHPRQNALTIF